jgi:hypothetical protein
MPKQKNKINAVSWKMCDTQRASNGIAGEYHNTELHTWTQVAVEVQK